MKKTALIKDFYREILGNKGRFLSILLIVALGVAFFSGIRSSQPDMELTGDVYFDRDRLYDGKVMSTLGLDDEDLEALEEVENIEQVMGEHSVDVLCLMEGREQVLHVCSLPEKMNFLTVEKGRLPENDREIVLDAELMGEAFKEEAVKIGDTVSFSSGTEEDLSESLKHEKYEVVGFVSTPVYLSFSRGVSGIGNGDVYGFAYVSGTAFSLDYYSTIYYRVRGSQELECFSQKYLDLIEETNKQVEAIEEESCVRRYDKVYGEGKEKLTDAQEELDEAKDKLTDARSKLADGNQQIADAEKELTEGKKKLADAKIDSEKELREGRQELVSGEATLKASRAKLDEGWSQYYSGVEELNIREEEYAKGKASYEENLQLLQSLKEKLIKAQASIPLLDAQIGEVTISIAITEDRIRELEQMDPPPLEEIEAEKAKLTELQGTRTALEKTLQEANMAVETLPGVIGQMEPELERGRLELEAARKALDEGRATLDSSKKQIQSGETEYASGKVRIDEGWAEYYKGEKLANEEIAKAEQKLVEGEAEIKIHRTEIHDAEYEIADGEKEIQENQEKIDDANKDLEDIEYPRWYIQDRMDDQDYSEFNDNALRMKKIGEVFPVIFFLVAALISLTTMTRMVEEQRISIGTLKALGYSRRAISAKYIFYSLLATVMGSVGGVILGEQTLPRVVISAYGIMYHYMDTMTIRFNLFYGGIAAGAAVLCVVGATIAACSSELKEVPARLMLPPSPKGGKRVFLEKIPAVWRRLNFSWKATIRNLTRYKKRFFMTLFGIGGGMALVLAGFGLRDSIMEVVTLQYQEIQLYDMDVYLKSDVSDRERKELEDLLTEEVGEEHFASAYVKSMSIESDEDHMDLYLFVPEDIAKLKDFVCLRERVGHELLEPDEEGIILTEKCAGLMDVSEGDQVTLSDDDGHSGKVTVKGICENYMSHYAYMTEELYVSLYGDKPVYNDYMVASAHLLPEETSEEEAAVFNGDMGERIMKCSCVMNVNYLINLKKRLDDMLSTLDLVILVLIFSAGILSFVVLYNLNNINITERKRELATLKVLGFRDMEVALYVYRENIILTLIGVVLGLVLGTFLRMFLITTVEVDTVMFGRRCTFFSYLMSVGITVVFSAIVNWIMYYKLRAISMATSLKSIE